MKRLNGRTVFFERTTETASAMCNVKLREGSSPVRFLSVRTFSLHSLLRALRKQDPAARRRF